MCKALAAVMNKIVLSKGGGLWTRMGMQTDGTEVWYTGVWGDNAGGGDANRILTLEAWGEALSDRRVTVDLRLSI